MISRLEALRYRCLHYVNQPLKPFQVLVGPNASGKTTFLDAISFLSDLVREGPEEAVAKRTANIYDLFWNHEGHSFQLAVELAIPDAVSKAVHDRFKVIRYEIELGLEPTENKIVLFSENVLLLQEDGILAQAKTSPEAGQTQSIITNNGNPDIRWIIRSSRNERTVYASEIHDSVRKDQLVIQERSAERSALAYLAAGEDARPVTAWLKEYLLHGIHTISLEANDLRAASPPGGGKSLAQSGSNLPRIIEHLEKTSSDIHEQWLAHVRTALPEIRDIQIVERPEDRHKYIKIEYADGTRIPSWMVSDGTLRLLALTILAYLPDSKGIHLIEEPENGIHPMAIETVYQSLSSAYDAQIFVTTHSPVILNMARKEDLLCFSRDEEGAVNVIEGNKHPALRNWNHEVALGVLFAGGVLS